MATIRTCDLCGVHVDTTQDSIYNLPLPVAIQPHPPFKLLFAQKDLCVECMGEKVCMAIREALGLPSAIERTVKLLDESTGELVEQSVIDVVLSEDEEFVKL